MFACDGIWIFRKDDCKADFLMPVIMAMQKPRARVIRGETESYVVAHITRRNDVTTNWILVIIFLASGASDDIKGVAM